MNEIRRLINLIESIEVDEDSERDHGLTSQPSDTCPMIDRVIKHIEEAETASVEAERNLEYFVKHTDTDNVDEAEGALSHIFDTTVSLSGLVDQLEEIRSHVVSIRGWGQEWKEAAKGYHDEAKSLEDEVQNLEYEAKH